MASRDHFTGMEDYLLPHRPSPAVPSAPFSTATQQHVNEFSNASETGSLNIRALRRRGGSFTKLFQWSSYDGNKSPVHSQKNSQGSYEDIPPVPALPVTTITQAHLNKRLPSTKDSGRKVSLAGSCKVSTEGRNMLRKVSRMGRGKEPGEKEQAKLAVTPPSLPLHEALPDIDGFSHDNAYITSNSPPRMTNFSRPGASMPLANTNSSSSPAYAIRPQASSSPDSSSRTNGEYVNESISRTESIANRGRSSYASSTVGGNMSSPRRIRRRKDPTPFNVLVIGAKNSGKTSLISFLRHSLSLSVNGHSTEEVESTIGGIRSSFTSHYLETEMDGERVGLTVWDSTGLEKHLIDLQLREMTTFVESKFEETFNEEQKVVRSPGVKDPHIHCVFLILDPIRLDATVATSTNQQKNGVSLSNVTGLDDELDLQVIRSLWGKTTVIPIISKADTLTIGHMAFLKRTVWDSIKAARLDPLEALELEDDIIEEDEEDEDDGTNGHNASDSAEDDIDNTPSKARKYHNRQSSLSASIKSSDDEAPYIPMSILSPDLYDLPPYAKSKSNKSEKVGRRFPWGLADPYNSEHCDFTRLRDSIFIEWRGELRDLSRSKWYENWRTSRLKNVPGTKQRIKGGVTPVGAVPKEGLTMRNFSGASTGSGSAVPRSVSSGVPQAAQVDGVVGSGSRVEA